MDRSWLYASLHVTKHLIQISISSQMLAGFFKQVVGGIKGIVDAASANISPFKVQVAKPEDHSGAAKREQIFQLSDIQIPNVVHKDEREK
ncbi:hypothetical protein KP79_PYT05267 [Mizuhopecten yessoensis]|uniref:Uncharacterized protein n=1 Tax=Mizuhopecten yessoensis TaxID=6573 RepID=A0A210QY58_MIZYE|nr:hypothetical protein KP79_PYT05267 [Mizuhopecten yessoensis]